MKISSLEGVTFGFANARRSFTQDPELLEIRASHDRATEQLSDQIYKLGGSVVYCETAEEAERLPHDYRLNSLHKSKSVIRNQLSKYPELPLLPELSLGSMDDQQIETLKYRIEGGQPCMVAYRERDRGLAKYLLERSAQIDSLLSLDTLYEAGGLLDNFVVRDYVETPSDRFTSYRVLVGASGTILAAGLAHSGHTIYDDKRVVRDCTETGDPKLVFVTSHAEDPASPFFLNAKDVRSNIVRGGSMIPIMGNNRRPITNDEAAILQAHGLDPAMPALPPEIEEPSKIIAADIAPHCDLTLGIDFLQELHGPHHLLELNTGPGAVVYSDCHYRGELDPLAASYLSRKHAIDQIARQDI